MKVHKDTGVVMVDIPYCHPVPIGSSEWELLVRGYADKNTMSLDQAAKELGGDVSMFIQEPEIFLFGGMLEVALKSK